MYGMQHSVFIQSLSLSSLSMLSTLEEESLTDSDELLTAAAAVVGGRDRGGSGGGGAGPRVSISCASDKAAEPPRSLISMVNDAIAAWSESLSLDMEAVSELEERLAELADDCDDDPVLGFAYGAVFDRVAGTADATTGWLALSKTKSISSSEPEPDVAAPVTDAAPIEVNGTILELLPPPAPNVLEKPARSAAVLGTTDTAGTLDSMDLLDPGRSRLLFFPAIPRMRSAFDLTLDQMSWRRVFCFAAVDMHSWMNTAIK